MKFDGGAQNPAERLKELRRLIAGHEYAYYVEARPTVSDADFDRLMAELKDLERRHPELITPDSPTQRVGGVASSFETVTHRVPMMSLDNTYSRTELADWVTRMEKLVGPKAFPIVAELKIDGVSASITYTDGAFISAATRGDGRVGDLITSNVKTIKSLPLTIASHHDIDLRGEVFLPKTALEQINREQIRTGNEPYKNCRNLAAGTLKSLDPKVASTRGLRVLVYGIAQATEQGFKLHSEVLEFLKAQGFPVNNPVKQCHNLDDIVSFLEDIERKRETFDFDIDGVVLKVDDLLTRQELGETTKAPRWATAFKFAQQQVVTRLKSVVWQVGRAQITPVANLEPVELGGTTVSRASLHNLDQIREKDIRVGDLVRVEKAGYIIPYVVEALHDQRTGGEVTIEPPQVCPACGQPTTIVLQTSEVVKCVNPDCQGVLGRRFTYFVSQLEIENVGPQVIERLIQAGLLVEIPDIFRLTAEHLLQVDRMGEKLAAKILKNIEAARRAPLSRLIAALGIPNVGSVAASNLAVRFPDLTSFRTANESQLQEIFGVGEKVASGVVEFMKHPPNQAWLDDLAGYWQGAATESDASKISTVFAGKQFVITGEGAVPRRQIEQFVKERGGRVTSTVSPKTHYLVIGSMESPDYHSTKKTKALQLNIPIIDEENLFRLHKTPDEP